MVKEIKSVVADTILNHIKYGDLGTGGTVSLGYAEYAVDIVSYLRPVITPELEEYAGMTEDLIRFEFVTVPDDEESYNEEDIEDVRRYTNNLPDRNPNWSITFTNPD